MLNRLEHARELLENRKTGLLKIIAASLQPPAKPQAGVSPRAQKKVRALRVMSQHMGAGPLCYSHAHKNL